MSTTHAANIITAANISNWTTAFNWGNHEGLYRPIDYTPTWSEITSKPTTILGFGITDAVTTSGNQTIPGDKSFTGLLNAINGAFVNLSISGNFTSTGNGTFNNSLFVTGNGSFGNSVVVNGILTSQSDFFFPGGAAKSSGSVGIGTTNPQGALDVNSTTGAFIVPRMTTAQRDALTAVNGMIIYNTTNNQFNFYENGAWVLK
jgi:hypothetical protein